METSRFHCHRSESARSYTGRTGDAINTCKILPVRTYERLILMRIRFRAFQILVMSLKQMSFVQNRICEIECGDGARVTCLFARVIQQLGF